MKKYVVILAAVTLNLCLGSIYAWSKFVPPLRAEYGFTNYQTQQVTGTCVLVFTAAAIVAGRLHDRFGPRPLAVGAGVLLGAGYLVASTAQGSFLRVLLGAGVLNGLAIGCGYVCPIATAVKWFPTHKGLVSGIALAGYGAAAVGLSAAVEALLARGWPVAEIFRWVGVVYACAGVGAGLLLFVPSPPGGGRRAAIRYRNLLGERRFWRLFAGMFCATLAGYALAGNLEPIAGSFGVAGVATAAIGAFAVGNAAGRIVWGGIFDRLGGARTLVLSLSAVTVSVTGVILSAGSTAGFVAAAIFAGFCYGGCFSIYAARVATLYGTDVFGTVYPLVLVAHGLCGFIGTAAVGRAYDLTDSFLPGLWGMGTLSLVGLGVYLLLGGRRTVSSRPAQ